jgi:hypothetical protein
VVDQTGDARSPLDQAAADSSITQAPTRAVDPVRIVTEPDGITVEPGLETSAAGPAGVHTGPDVVDEEVQVEDDRTAAPAPRTGFRRRLSPRPIPVNWRRRPPAPATDEEPTPAEEMDYVGTHDKPAGAAGADKAVTPPTEAVTDNRTETPAGDAAGRGATATATKPSRPKTAAEIVAEQRAREKAAAERAAPAAPADPANDPGETAVTKTVAKVSAAKTGAAGNKPAGKTAAAPEGKGKQALTVGSGVKRVRNWIASLIWLAAVIAAAVLALGALFTALDQTNQSNEIVRWVLERGHDLVGPFKDLFRLETAKNTLLVNWGIAALIYLIAGKLIERFVRP